MASGGGQQTGRAGVSATIRQGFKENLTHDPLHLVHAGRCLPAVGLCHPGATTDDKASKVQWDFLIQTTHLKDVVFMVNRKNNRT